MGKKRLKFNLLATTIVVSSISPSLVLASNNNEASITQRENINEEEFENGSNEGILGEDDKEETPDLGTEDSNGNDDESNEGTQDKEESDKDESDKEESDDNLGDNDKVEGEEPDNQNPSETFLDANSFSDVNLFKAINSYLGKTDLLTPISVNEINSLKEINLSNKNIKNLSGIESLVNLEKIDISKNNISDISILSKFKNLREVIACNNNIANISLLDSLALDKADFSEQTINLSKVNTNEPKFILKNPLTLSKKGGNIKFNISNNGKYRDDSFVWENLTSGEYNLNIEFSNDSSNIIFSGVIVQPIKSSLDEKIDLDIDINLSTSEWTNKDIYVLYNINGASSNLVKSVSFEKQQLNKLNGKFKVTSNGKYKLNVLLSNGKKIEKVVNIDNIDKSKPILKLEKKTFKNNKVNIDIKATDELSGIDYIWLPTGEKVYSSDATFLTDISGDIKILAYDKAGNYSELALKLDDTKTQKPIIFANNQVVVIGDDFDPLKGVYAKDYKGNDISENIEISKSNLNLDVLGEYYITYKVVDSYGNSSTKTILVEVVSSKEDISDNKNDKNEILENISKENEDEQNENSNPFKFEVLSEGYIPYIAMSLVAGFVFLFKSGKDNF